MSFLRHILIFNIHSEYEAVFTLAESQDFNLNLLSIDKLKLPYWLMNSQELESLFIESNENNSYNQISMFKQAVIFNKMKHEKRLKLLFVNFTWRKYSAKKMKGMKWKDPTSFKLKNYKLKLKTKIMQNELLVVYFTQKKEMIP